MKKKTKKAAEKALTRSELVRLYEEFKHSHRERYYRDQLYYYQGALYRLKGALGIVEVDRYNEPISSKPKKKFVWSGTIRNKIEEIEDKRPSYAGPTFEEFFQSLQESYGTDVAEKACVSYGPCLR